MQSSGQCCEYAVLRQRFHYLAQNCKCALCRAQLAVERSRSSITCAPGTRHSYPGYHITSTSTASRESIWNCLEYEIDRRVASCCSCCMTSSQVMQLTPSCAGIQMRKTHMYATHDLEALQSLPIPESVLSRAWNQLGECTHWEALHS